MTGRHLGGVIVGHIALHFLALGSFLGFFLRQEALDPLRSPAQLLQGGPALRALLRPFSGATILPLALQPVLPPVRG